MIWLPASGSMGIVPCYAQLFLINTDGQIQKEMIEKLNKAIEDYSLSISSELSNIRFWEVDRIKVVISTRVKMALIDCVEMEAFELEKERLKLSKEYDQGCIKMLPVQHLKQKLTEVKQKIKQVNRLRTDFQDEKELLRLRNFLREKGLQNILDEFFEKHSPPKKSIRKEAICHSPKK